MVTGLIFLIGLPAAGKTTLAQPLADALGLQVFDTDCLIESTVRCPLADYLSRVPESQFRDLEQQVLRRVIDHNPRGAVVACGGGLPFHDDNMDRMLCAGTVVWLDAPDARLIRRLRLAPGQRPYITDDPQSIARLRSLRTPVYSRANLRIDSSRLESAPEIELTLNNLLHLLNHD